MSKKSKDKLFGKWNDLGMLLLAFIFTTIGGSIIGYKLQNRSWEKQHEQSKLQNEVIRAENVYEDISDLMYERLYIMRKLFWGYEDNKDAKVVEERWEDYRKLLNKWNKGIGKNFGLLEVHFGVKLKETFRCEIHHKIRLIGKRLEEIKKLDSIPEIKLNEIKNDLEQIDSTMHQFNIDLINSIRDENVGQFRVTHYNKV